MLVDLILGRLGWLVRVNTDAVQLYTRLVNPCICSDHATIAAM